MNRLILFSLSLLLCTSFVSSKKCLAKDTQKFVVVLDAGHGGGDVGTPHRNCKKDEKTIALDVVLRIGKLIEANHSDVKVVYTRKKDVYPSLPERTQIAKKAKGDLFISVHVNAAPDRSARGIETYVFGVTGLKGKSADEQKRIRERMANERENLDISGKQVDFDLDMDIETKILCQAQREKNNIYSEEVANLVHNSMLYAARRSSYKTNVKDRGVKQKNIFVLCYSPMPAILVELGYMSNPVEERFLNSEEGLSAFSRAIYDGFVKYKTSWNKRKLSTSAANNEATIEIKEKQAEVKQDSKPVIETKKTVVEVKTSETTKPNTAKDSKPETNNSETKQVTKSVDNKKAEEIKPVEKPVEPKIQKVEEVVPIQETLAKPTDDKTIIYYKIQILTSDRLLKTDAKEFKGLSPVDHYIDKGVHKYTYSKSDKRGSLSKELIEVKKKFPGAFIIATDAAGNRIR